jgi:hypothetical protein
MPDARYGIFRSDPAEPEDELVARLPTHARAAARVRRLNREVLCVYGRPHPGRPVVLYYCGRLWHDEKRGRVAGNPRQGTLAWCQLR